MPNIWDAVTAVAAVIGLLVAWHANRQAENALECAKDSNRIARGSALNSWIMEQITAEFAFLLHDRDTMRSLCAPMPAAVRGPYVTKLQEARETSLQRMSLLELVDDRIAGLGLVTQRADWQRAWDTCLDGTTTELTLRRATDLRLEHERLVNAYIVALKAYVAKHLDGDP